MQANIEQAAIFINACLGYVPRYQSYEWTDPILKSDCRVNREGFIEFLRTQELVDHSRHATSSFETADFCAGSAFLLELLSIASDLRVVVLGRTPLGLAVAVSSGHVHSTL